MNLTAKQPFPASRKHRNSKIKNVSILWAKFPPCQRGGICFPVDGGTPGALAFQKKNGPPTRWVCEKSHKFWWGEKNPGVCVFGPKRKETYGGSFLIPTITFVGKKGINLAESWKKDGNRDFCFFLKCFFF